MPEEDPAVAVGALELAAEGRLARRAVLDGDAGALAEGGEGRSPLAARTVEPEHQRGHAPRSRRRAWRATAFMAPSACSCAAGIRSCSRLAGSQRRAGALASSPRSDRAQRRGVGEPRRVFQHRGDDGGVDGAGVDGAGVDWGEDPVWPGRAQVGGTAAAVTASTSPHRRSPARETGPSVSHPAGRSRQRRGISAGSGGRPHVNGGSIPARDGVTVSS